MRNVKILVATAFVGMMMMTLGLPAAKADSANWETYMTFSAPVEIPGMVLIPGKYEFKLLDYLMPDDVVAIYNSQGELLEAIPAIPDYRLKPASKTLVTLEERSAGSPEAIKSWFYPGQVYGVEFLYPKASPSGTSKTK